MSEKKSTPELLGQSSANHSGIKGQEQKTLPETPKPCPVRLNRAIAMAGYCSRRKADELIFAGKVKVNGQIELNPGTQVLPEMKIEVEGKTLSGPQEYEYVILNKPAGYICTMKDPQNRPRANDLLPASLKRKRLCPAGRLDFFSEGLLLLTNDGEVIQKLCHPSCHQPKTYEVIVRGEVAEAQLLEMKKGMMLEGKIRLMPVEVSAKKLDSDKTRLIITLHQGINRQIRRMCAQLNLVILKLRRLSQGSLSLGQLKPGKWRKLSASEIAKLRKLKIQPQKSSACKRSR